MGPGIIGEPQPRNHPLKGGPDRPRRTRIHRWRPAPGSGLRPGAPSQL